MDDKGDKAPKYFPDRLKVIVYFVPLLFERVELSSAEPEVGGYSGTVRNLQNLSSVASKPFNLYHTFRTTNVLCLLPKVDIVSFSGTYRLSGVVLFNVMAPFNESDWLFMF